MNMALRIDDLERWVARKKQETRDAEPLSIQANISVLSARLWVAEQHLDGVRKWLDNAGFPDDTEARYAQGYNDAMNDVRRIVGGDA